jgi:hypothetical protein
MSYTVKVNGTDHVVDVDGDAPASKADICIVFL